MNRRGLRFSALTLLSVLAFGLGAAVVAAEPATHIVTIESMHYSPEAIIVHPGDSVVFVNKDIVPHTATEQATKAFDSSIINAGEQWKLVVPDRPGTLHYRCLFHPLMKGSITVQVSSEKAATPPLRPR